MFLRHPIWPVIRYLTVIMEIVKINLTVVKHYQYKTVDDLQGNQFVREKTKKSYHYINQTPSIMTQIGINNLC